jgi:hypothetical protein
MCLERDPLRLVSPIEELLGSKSSGCGLENRDYSLRGTAALTMRHPSIRKRLALTLSTSGHGVCLLVLKGVSITCFFKQLDYILSRLPIQ